MAVNEIVLLISVLCWVVSKGRVERVESSCAVGLSEVDSNVEIKRSVVEG